MRRKHERLTDDADRVVKDIKRQTRRRFSAEEKIQDCAVRPSWRRQHCRAVSAGGNCPEPVLQLVEGVYGSWQEAAGWRYHAREANTDEVKGLRK